MEQRSRRNLRILEGFDLEAMGHLSADYVHVLTEALKLGFADRDKYYGDPLFTDGFEMILQSAGVKPVKLPPKSPNLNAYAERFVRSIKEECLSRMIFFGEESLRRAVSKFLDHYHRERNHQGLGNEIIEPGHETGQDVGDVQCRERLGGMLRYYYRDAA